MPLQATSGAASQDAFGGNGVAVVPTYIEDVFSTYLYTGNNSTQTITNGIDLSGKGGLVWAKKRNTTPLTNHLLFDTLRGVDKILKTSSTDAEVSTSSLSAFNSNGFTVENTVGLNQTGELISSWTFRKQPKFFDVVTYTGTGSARTVAHSLGSIPGCILVKRTDTSGDWQAYHRSISNTEYLVLNSTAAKATGTNRWNSTDPTSTVFTVGTDATVNASGGTYVAYIFAHNAGGFGLTGSDNVISCGSYTGTGAAGNFVSLGYEPQWVMIKRTNLTGNWSIHDIMRGSSNTSYAFLEPNITDAESASTASSIIAPTATGFNANATGSGTNASGSTYIYIAIRRPMKVPTTGTSVYKAITYNGVNTAGQVISGVGFSPDFALTKARSTDSGLHQTWMDRLRGGTRYLFSDSTAAEGNTAGYYIRSFDMDGVTYGTAYGDYTNAAYTYVVQFLKRAPSFFDEVCYTGTGSARTVSHNLTVAPELLFVKARSNAQNWSALCTLNSGLQGRLNTTDALSAPSAAVWGSGGVYVAPTSSVFTVGTDNETNASTWTYVAYLFATCAGVSKVGSYTGTGALQTVNCGFTSGARFVLIKRTDSTGDWWTYDSARGISSGNDPYLFLNSTAAEVTSTNYVDTDSTGFKVTAAAPAGLNASGGTYIFLAIS